MLYGLGAFGLFARIVFSYLGAFILADRRSRGLIRSLSSGKGASRWGRLFFVGGGHMTCLSMFEAFSPQLIQSGRY